jgi:threonine/homoserine/homoserine lactone efflux protein
MRCSGWGGLSGLAGLAHAAAQPGDAPVLKMAPRQYFRQGALITLLNPKAIVFYMAFFPLFVDPPSQGVLTFA